MEERLLRRTAIGSFLCLLIVVSLAILFSRDAKTNINRNNHGDSTNTGSNNLEKTDIENQYISEDINIESMLGDKYIAVKKPEHMNYNIKIENSYMDNRLLLTLEDMDASKLHENYIVRVNHEVEFIGRSKVGNRISAESDNENADGIISSKLVNSTKDKQASSNGKLYLIPEEIKADGSILTYGDIPKDIILDPVASFTYSNVDEMENNATLIEFCMDTVYETNIFQNENYIYIALKAPKEVYKKVIVIDAGHGGKDPGAYAKAYNIYEKQINLEIVLQLKAILEQNNDIKVYYTRLEDKTVYLNPRVNLANKVQADLFISIHCNASDSASAGGLEILYNEEDTAKELNSLKLAELLLNDLRGITGKINRGLVPASEMVIVGKSEVPVALIEAGFITNGEDYAVLSDNDRQKEFAKAIYGVILQALK